VPVQLIILELSFESVFVATIGVYYHFDAIALLLAIYKATCIGKLLGNSGFLLL
jgi:hypothetical protein